MRCVKQTFVSQIKNDLQAESVAQRYAEAYRQLYHRSPRELRILDTNWVIVNGARMRLDELEYLTKHLQQEYSQGLTDQRGVLRKLIDWLKK